MHLEHRENLVPQAPSTITKNNRHGTKWIHVVFACALSTLLSIATQPTLAGATPNYQRVGLYASRSAAVNVSDRNSQGYPASVDGDSLWVRRASGDTMCVFQSFADSGIMLRSTATAPSYVEYALSPSRTMTAIGVMACGRQIHASDAGRDAMRITVFYENGDSAATVLAVGKHLRDVYYGWDFCNGTQLFFYNTAPGDPLSVQLFADPNAGGGNFLDAQEIFLPYAKRTLKATRIRVSAVPLGRPCMGGTLWSSVYLAGLTTWTEPRHVLLVHGICGSADGWDPFAQVLADSGFVVDRVQYGSLGNSLRPAHYVNTLASKIATMPPGPIAVVAHSMGGLIARDFVRRELAIGRTNPVAQLVTLGTPHHGSDALAKILGWGPIVDRLVGPIFGACLSSPFSTPALLDMVPGASYLNRLNYGVQDSLKDSIAGHGWSAHQPETTLPADVYVASIAGTGSICDPRIRGLLWPNDPVYHPNDGTVATGGSLLSSTSAFRAADPALALEKPAAHTTKATEPCGVAYYSFSTLAKRVATILRTSPAAPPLSAFSPEMAFAPTTRNLSTTLRHSFREFTEQPSCSGRCS